MDKIKLSNHISQINQNGISNSSSSDTDENNNNKRNNLRTKFKVIRKPEILDISSFDAFRYKNLRESNNNGRSVMETLIRPDDSDDGQGDVFNVLVKLSDFTDKKYKINNKRKTRREKIEELKNKSIRNGGGELEENALYASMIKSYEVVLGYDIYEGYHPTHENCAENKTCTFRKRTLSEHEKEAFMRRDLVLTELADSEKNYLDDLEFIVTKYLPTMNEENVTEELLKVSDNIILNIKDIYEFHQNSFHQKIEECFENPDLLDTTFTEYEEQLTTLYTHYCSKKPFADEFLDTHENELDALCRSEFPHVKLNIKDFLIKPVQRLMKYQLLLSSIRKYGIKAGKDSTYLNTSIEVMARVPKEANDAMHVGLISGFGSPGCNIQQLMTHGELEVSVGKTKPRTMHVFLFETVVVFTEKASKMVPEYKCIDSQDTGTLGYTDNTNMTFVMWFRKHNKTDIYICEAKSLDEKEKWKQKVKGAMGLKEIMNRRRSCRRQLTIEITPPNSDPLTTTAKFQTLMIEEAVIKAMEGHPRLGIMTERLRSNIEKYIASEFIIPSMQDAARHIAPLSRSQTNPNIAYNPARSLTLDHIHDSGSRSPSPESKFKSKFGFKRTVSPNTRRKQSATVKMKDSTFKKPRGNSIF